MMRQIIFRLKEHNLLNKDIIMDDEDIYDIALLSFSVIAIVLVFFDSKSILGLVSGIMFIMVAICAILLVFQQGVIKKHTRLFDKINSTLNFLAMILVSCSLGLKKIIAFFN